MCVYIKWEICIVFTLNKVFFSTPQNKDDIYKSDRERRKNADEVAILRVKIISMIISFQRREKMRKGHTIVGEFIIAQNALKV